MLTACDSGVMTGEPSSAEVSGDALERYRGFLERLAGRQWPVSMRRHVGISDVVQVAMVRASTAADRYWGNTESNVKAWLKKILLNVIINESRRLRTQRRQFEREQPADVENLPKDGSSVSADLLRSELREVVFAALSRIKPEYAAVVRLREFQGLSFCEIGVRLNRSSEAVRKVWSRAIKSLEAELTTYAQHNG